MEAVTRVGAARRVAVINRHVEIVAILNERTGTRKMRLLNFSFIEVLVAVDLLLYL